MFVTGPDEDGSRWLHYETSNGNRAMVLITDDLGKEVVMESFDKLWDERQCATYLGCAVSSLQKGRVRGDGPPFVKSGRLVRYRPEDVRAWVAARVVTSTSMGKRL